MLTCSEPASCRRPLRRAVGSGQKKGRSSSGGIWRGLFRWLLHRSICSVLASRPASIDLKSKEKTGLRAETARKADRDHGLPSQGTVLGPTSPATSPNVSARGRGRTACSQGIEGREQIRTAQRRQE